jgi:hypothetical protein
MIKRSKRSIQNVLTNPLIPMPKLNELLKAKIRSEMTQQVKLSEKVLPSIAQIDIYQAYKM